MAQLSPSRRVRRTPFSAGVEEAGVKGYTVYNRMLLPTLFDSVEADYRHLKTHVQVWDVACERQVQIAGPDARRLLQMLTPRDLKRLGPTRCLYVPVCGPDGGMLNDPVAVMAGPETFWLSLADSDLLLWVMGIAAGRGFDVEVTEPDVSPLAIQGPKADDLAARVLGEGVRALPFFGTGRFRFGDHDWIVARSGYSKQGGFEVYVEGAENGMALWQALFDAGADLDVRAGCPNLIERIEGGLLSYGNDMTRENTPLECGLGRYVDDSALAACIGGAALRAERAAGSARMLRPVAIEGGALPACDRPWPLRAGAAQAGQVTSAAWSPDFGTGVAIAMVECDHWSPGTRLEVETPDGTRPATVRETFWN